MEHIILSSKWLMDQVQMSIITSLENKFVNVLRGRPVINLDGHGVARGAVETWRPGALSGRRLRPPER